VRSRKPNTMRLTGERKPYCGLRRWRAVVVLNDTSRPLASRRDVEVCAGRRGRIRAGRRRSRRHVAALRFRFTKSLPFAASTPWPDPVARLRLPLARNGPAIVTKPFFGSLEDVRKQACDRLEPDQQRGSIMWAIFNMLYRQYCRACLAEFRKYHLHTGAV
jgi:hypothetical protein